MLLMILNLLQWLGERIGNKWDLQIKVKESGLDDRLECENWSWTTSRLNQHQHVSRNEGNQITEHSF